MRFLTDSGWMGVIIGVTSIIVTAFISYKARKRKSLSYEVLSENPLISMGEEVKGKLQLLFDGNPVQHLHLLLVKFINDGNIPVLATDYERPLTLRFDGPSTILSAEHLSGNPNSLVSSAIITDKAVSIEPVLMNGSDCFTIKLLVAEYGGSFQVDARIVGVKQVRTTRSQARLYASWLLPALIGLSIALVAFFVPFKERVEARLSSPPSIMNIRVSQTEVHIGDTVYLTASVNAPLDEKLEYRWTATPGEIVGEGLAARFMALRPGVNKVMLEVSDRFGRTSRMDVTFSVVPALGAPQGQRNKP